MKEAPKVLTAGEVQKKYGIDLITAETITAALVQICRTGFNRAVRSAFSSVMKDIMDGAVGIQLVEDDGNTEMCAVCEGCTQFAFTTHPFTQLIIKEWGINNFNPGDVVFCNDPFRGAIHMPDIALFRAVFWEGKPVFVVTDAAHFTDIGGSVPGGFANGLQYSYEEGVRIPPTLLYAKDVPVRSSFNMMIENTRIPHYTLGDLRACYGALRIVEGLLLDLIKRYGLKAVQAGARYGMDHSERLMRLAISRVPDGVYEAEDYLDDDSVEPKPVKFKVTCTVKGDQMEIDWSGSQRQPLGNTCVGWKEASCCSLMMSKMMLEPASPANAGLARPIEIIIPVGSVMCGLPPTSTSNHVDVMGRAADTMVQALNKALPGQGMAADVGTASMILPAGLDTRPGKLNMPWGVMLGPGGGWGGTYKTDGLSWCILYGGNCRSAVVEHLEQEMPLLIWAFQEQADSAGAGKYRGGYGSYYMVEFLCPSILSNCTDRARFCPPGAAGGGSAGTAYGYFVEKVGNGPALTRDGITPTKYLKPLFGIFDSEKRFVAPGKGEFGLNAAKWSGKFGNLFMPEGTIVRISVPGGGGYGNPLDRDPAKVQREVWNEWMSIGFAERAYGVIIKPDTFELDNEATARKRQELREKQKLGEWQVPVAVYEPWPVEKL